MFFNWKSFFFSGICAAGSSKFSQRNFELCWIFLFRFFEGEFDSPRVWRRRLCDSVRPKWIPRSRQVLHHCFWLASLPPLAHSYFHARSATFPIPLQSAPQPSHCSWSSSYLFSSEKRELIEWKLCNRAFNVDLLVCRLFPSVILEMAARMKGVTSFPLMPSRSASINAPLIELLMTESIIIVNYDAINSARVRSLTVHGVLLWHRHTDQNSRT